MSLTPLRNMIVVRRLDAEQKTPGGLLLPDAAQKRPLRGVVVAVGPGSIAEHEMWASNGDVPVRFPMETSPGDRVVFGEYAGHEIDFEDEKLLIMSEDDVLAVIK